MRPVLALALLLLLAACTVGAPIRSPSDGPTRPQGGGSAASRGPLYCQTVPADLSERDDWNRICGGGFR